MTNGSRPALPVDFALTYAAFGCDVLPLGTGDNSPHEMLGAGWCYSEDDEQGRPYIGSCDPAQIHEWWGDRCGEPTANIGVVTGRPSQIAVVDLDTSGKRSKYPGRYHLMRWLDEVGKQLPGDMPTAKTPSGGWHLWLRYDGDDYFPTRIGWLPNVDVKVDGGFVAVPPSVRVKQGITAQPDGSHRFAPEFTEYRWVQPLPATLDQLPEAPDWLLADVLDRPRRIYPSGDPSSLGGSGRLTAEALIQRGGFGTRTGSRDCDCLAFARVLFNDYDGDTAAVTQEVLRVWSVTPDTNTFPWRQAEKCIRSARGFWERATRS